MIKYVNPPQETPANVYHRTFYSEIFGHEVGYNIYLPEGYEGSAERWPVEYHLHGWMGNESSDIWTMARVCRERRAITVFPNNSPTIGELEDLPVEDVIINELIPHIDRTYRTQADGRSISGFSMGGGLAFMWAVKYPGLFSAVTAYAGTYHHYFNPAYSTVGVDAENAAQIYRAMVNDGKHDVGATGHGNVIGLVNSHAGDIGGRLAISLHIGEKDVLYCDNEILRMHLEELGIPHEYIRYPGAEHCLSDIL